MLKCKYNFSEGTYHTMGENAKYLYLAKILKTAIHSGEYSTGEKLPGENELAFRYCMSRQTVRQALSLLEREGLILRRQGSGTYVQKHLPNNRISRNIGVVATYISEYIFPSILRGIEEKLSENGFFPLLGATQNRVDNERRILTGMLEKGIAGLIVEGTKSALPNPNLPLYQKLRELGTPVVFFNGYYPALPHSVSITMDDRAGGYEAVSYLLKKGHRKIGAIFKGDDIQGLERYAGYLSGILENGLSFSDEWVLWFHSENRRQLFSEACERENVLNAFRECTAVVCYNDEVAVKLSGLLREAGKRIPQDLALVSFDNSLLSEIGPVRITSLEHPKEHLGIYAAQTLISMINGFSVESVSLPWRLVEKGSVSPIPLH